MTVTVAASTPSPEAQLAQIRPLRRGDGPLLDQVMAGMSPQSRYQRFHVPKPRLSRAERDYLTDVDQHDRLALIALADGGSAVGVARVSRWTDRPWSGEVAVSVVDAWQHHGVGEELLIRIAARARGVGLTELVALVLNETGLVARLERRGWHVVERDGPATTLAIRTTDVA